MDYKYTGELNALCWILGREEELNNHWRLVTHEENAPITGVDEIRRLESQTSPIQRQGVISGDRLENRIAREQREEYSKLVG